MPEKSSNSTILVSFEAPKKLTPETITGHYWTCFEIWGIHNISGLHSRVTCENFLKKFFFKRRFGFFEILQCFQTWLFSKNLGSLSIFKKIWRSNICQNFLDFRVLSNCFKIWCSQKTLVVWNFSNQILKCLKFSEISIFEKFDFWNTWKSKLFKSFQNFSKFWTFFSKINPVFLNGFKIIFEGQTFFKNLDFKRFFKFFTKIGGF